MYTYCVLGSIYLEETLAKYVDDIIGMQLATPAAPANKLHNAILIVWNWDFISDSPM